MWLSWIWLPLTTTAHHPWTTSPIMHCTHTFPSTITPITQLSPFTHQPWLPHHTCTSFTHSHKSSTQTLTQGEVLFCPGLHSERYSSCHLCVWPRTARPWNSEPVPVTSTPAWYCLRLCSASDIPVFACWPLPVCFCLCSINFLLQVNPLASDQSLQKTSPNEDSAAFPRNPGQVWIHSTSCSTWDRGVHLLWSTSLNSVR